MTEQKQPRRRASNSQSTAAKKKEAETNAKAFKKGLEELQEFIAKLTALPEISPELLSELKTSIDALNEFAKDPVVYEDVLAEIEKARNAIALEVELKDLREVVSALEARATVITEGEYSACIEELTTAVTRCNEIGDDIYVLDDILNKITDVRKESQLADNANNEDSSSDVMYSQEMTMHKNTLDEYIVTMSPGAGSSISEQMKHQKRLFAVLNSIFQLPSDELRDGVMLIVDAFKEHDEGCFSTAMVHRNFDNITMSGKHIKAYTALLRLFSVAAEKGPGNVHRFVDLPQLEDVLDPSIASVVVATFTAV